MSRPKEKIKCLNPKCDSELVFTELYFYNDSAYGHNQSKIYECVKCHERWKA